jgi:hypothetical protein
MSEWIEGYRECCTSTGLECEKRFRDSVRSYGIKGFDYIQVIDKSDGLMKLGKWRPEGYIEIEKRNGYELIDMADILFFAKIDTD